MLANAAGIMPDQLRFEADQQFFERGLERGRVWWCMGATPTEQQPHSHLRRRLILTRPCAGHRGRPVGMKRRCSGIRRRRRRDASLDRAGGARRQRGRDRRNGRVRDRSWTVMTFSTYRGRPVCGCLVVGRLSRGARANAGGRHRNMGSTAANESLVQRDLAGQLARCDAKNPGPCGPGLSWEERARLGLSQDVRRRNAGKVCWRRCQLKPGCARRSRSARAARSRGPTPSRCSSCRRRRWRASCAACR